MYNCFYIYCELYHKLQDISNEDEKVDYESYIKVY